MNSSTTPDFWMPPLLKQACCCGGTPLLVGSLVYATWRITRWESLISAGMITIAIGIIVFLVGAVLVARYLCTARRLSRRNWAHLIFASCLLFANFPAAVFFTLSAIDVITRYHVTVINKSQTTIENFELSGPGVPVELGPIGPGRSMSKSLHFRGDGALSFSARQQGKVFGGTVDDYVTGDLGGDCVVRVGLGDGCWTQEQLTICR